jgi:L-asparaginase
MKDKSVLILYTGGTAGMVRNQDGALAPFNFQQIQDLLPEIHRLPFAVEHWAVDKPIDSSNLKPELWNQLAEVIHEKYEHHLGFVVLHGTDTMAYTATALSFLLQGLSKPVILTGAQLPIGDIRTDAKENILTALEIAGAVNLGLPVVPEVCIYFDYALFRGNRSSKLSSDRFEAFGSPNYPKLAEAGTQIKFFQPFIQAVDQPSTFKKVTFIARVATLRLFPGITAAHLKAILSSDEWDVVILQTYGSGNAPSEPSIMDVFKHATQSGKVIINISQCHSGRVVQEAYEVGRQLSEIGVLGGFDLTMEAALVKTMYLLGQEPFQTENFKQQFARNIAGELSEFASNNH